MQLMIQALRRRVNATTIIAVFALVFAMTGGAYAAKKLLITSTSQISPKVLKSLKGNAGAKGANGANGAAGAQGPVGPGGAQGPAGAAGAAGAKGEDGKEGKEGKEGKAGTTGFTKTLPSGQTETGAWAASQESENFGSTIPVSFSIPLSEGLDEEHVFFIEKGKEAEFEEDCPGTVETPLAAKGDLCVYTSLENGLAPASIDRPSALAAPGADTSGAILRLSPESAEAGTAAGSWAVTAP
jgi:Collagen triple helix repeat (20 copies)